MGVCLLFCGREKNRDDDNESDSRLYSRKYVKCQTVTAASKYRCVQLPIVPPKNTRLLAAFFGGEVDSVIGMVRKEVVYYNER